MENSYWDTRHNISFRISCIFSFISKNIFYRISKVILIAIFILPYLVMELQSIFWSLFYFLPYGFCIAIPFCFICDLLSRACFVVMTLPDAYIKNQRKNKNYDANKIIPALSPKDYEVVKNAIECCANLTEIAATQRELYEYDVKLANGYIEISETENLIRELSIFKNNLIQNVEIPLKDKKDNILLIGKAIRILRHQIFITE